MKKLLFNLNICSAARRWKPTAILTFRKQHFILLLFICFLFQPHPLFAQDSTFIGLPQKWSLQDCFDYAQKNNIQLQTLEKDVDINYQSLLQAKAARLPNLTASTSQNFTNSKNANPVVGGFQTESNFASNYGASSSMILYQGGYLKNNIQMQQLNIESANLNVQQALNNITIQITQAYLNILLSKENIIALQNVSQTSQAQYNNGKVLFDAGSIAKTELVQLEATLASDNYNLVTAQNQLRQNTLTLKQILELPTSFNFQVPDSVAIAIPSEATDLQTAQDSALQNRPEVKNSEIALQQSDLQLKQFYAATRPTISAGASLATGYSDGTGIKYYNQLNNNFYQQIGVTMDIPIFNNRTNKTNIEKSKIEIDQSKLALKSTKLVLSQEVEQAYISFLNAKAQYDAAQVQFSANEENYRIANEQLKLGALNTVDFLVQKNLYIQAQQALIQSKYNVILNHGIYEFYLGEPITL
ncbi:MAG TPA: TolC family protein [Hanamia sp.]